MIKSSACSTLFSSFLFEVHQYTSNGPFAGVLRLLIRK